MLPALHAGGVERGTLEIARSLVAQGHRSLVMSAGGRMVEQLENEGSRHFTWAIGKKSLFTLRQVGPLRRFLQEQRVDILHLRSRMPAWVGYLAWRGMPAATRPRLVTTVHGPYSINRYSAVMTRGERVIAVSDTIREYLLANYAQLDPARIHVVHRGVDPHEFSPRFRPADAWRLRWYKQYPRLEQARVLTLPARLTRWKGQVDFIELIASLRASGLLVHGLIVGDTAASKRHYRAELEQRIRDRGLEDAIILTGHRSDLREIMASSDLVLSLSREPEAFGRTVPEALALGIPVVGYAHGGVGEVLRAWYPQGQVLPGDTDALSHRVRELLLEPRPVPPQTDFTLAAMQASTLELYRELLAEPRS